MCLLRAEEPVCGPGGYFIDTRPGRRVASLWCPTSPTPGSVRSATRPGPRV